MINYENLEKNTQAALIKRTVLGGSENSGQPNN